MAGPNRHRFTITVIARFWCRLNEPLQPVTLLVIDKQSEELTLMASYVPALSDSPTRIASLL